MLTLQNKIQEKLLNQKRISYIPISEVDNVVQNTKERMKKYNQIYIKRMVGSYGLARKILKI